MDEDYYELWHMRVDDEDRDYDKLLGVFSTREKAEQGLWLLRDKPGFRDHPDGFEILDGTLDHTGMSEGFITVLGGQELEAPQNVYTSIRKRGPKDIPVWALGAAPQDAENGGDFACRMMNEHHGPGNWTKDNVEFDQLRKFGNNGNLDPRANLPSAVSVVLSKPTTEPVYYTLWHRRTDEKDYDHDMLLGVYSTREKAEQGLAILRGQLGFRDYPHSFEINWGRVDEIYETEGFVTLSGEDVPGSFG